MKIHLVDGTYELFRMFFGAPAARTSDGREVGATRAFLRSFAAFVGSPGVSHIAVAFDRVIESFRNDLFAGYKTGDGIHPDLWAQFPLAERACEALGIVTWPMVEFEADDAIATAAARFTILPEVEQIVICSPDKDFGQCVDGDRVVLWDRRRDRILDEAGVREKFGVEPRSIPDFLALVGDSADGIPGIPKWGERSAATVLAQYGHIEAIPDDSTSWEVSVRGATTLARNLRERRELAALYKELATLRIDAPLPENIDGLRWSGADRSALEALCALLEDDAVISRVSRWRS